MGAVGVTVLVGPAAPNDHEPGRELLDVRLQLRAGCKAVDLKLGAVERSGAGEALRERDPQPGAPPRQSHTAKGAWPEPLPLGRRLLDAVRDRLELDVERAGAVANVLVDTAQHPEKLARAVGALRTVAELARFDSHSPLHSFGRARRLSGTDLPFEAVRRVKQALGGAMIDVILTVMARRE